MADPDLQIWEVGGGEGHPDPEIRGAQSQALQALVWSKNKRGRGGSLPWIRHWSDRSDSLKKRPILITLL